MPVFFFAPIFDVFLLPFRGLFEDVLRSLNRSQETTAAERIMKKTDSNNVKRDSLSSTTKTNVLLVQSCSVLAQHVFLGNCCCCFLLNASSNGMFIF